MIKKYSQFVTETFSKELHNSLGEYIEDLAEKDEFIRMIASESSKLSDASISLSNAINVLDDLEKVALLKRVENHLNGAEGEIDVYTSTDVNDLLGESYGRSVLTTFLKCLTALGFKDNQPNMSEVPPEFLIFFKFDGIDSSKIDGVFKRFKSLSSISIDYTQPHMGLYFGVKNNGEFEYGCFYDKLFPIGSFKLNRTAFNSLKLAELKSASGLKKVLLNLSLQDVLLMGAIKNAMESFQPGYHQSKKVPMIEDRMITFAYEGLGKWDNGVLDEGERIRVTNDLKTYLSKYKWSEKVQLRIYPDKLWVYINIKLK